MGSLFSHQPANGPAKHKPKATDIEIAILRIKLKRDNILSKRNDLQRRVDKENQIIKQLVKEKRKDEAIYYLGKKKLLEKSLKSITDKLDFIEGRISRIEQTQDDAEFTKMVNDSNEVIKQLLQQVDVEAVLEANELDREVNIHNEEVLRAIDLNKHDPDIVKEFESLGGSTEDLEQSIDQKVNELLADKSKVDDKNSSRNQNNQVGLEYA